MGFVIIIFMVAFLGCFWTGNAFGAIVFGVLFMFTLFFWGLEANSGCVDPYDYN